MEKTKAWIVSHIPQDGHVQGPFEYVGYNNGWYKFADRTSIRSKDTVFFDYLEAQKAARDKLARHIEHLKKKLVRCEEYIKELEAEERSSHDSV